MHIAAQAYGRTSKTGLPTRELEATLLSQSAARLAAARDRRADDFALVVEALEENRKLWSLLVRASSAPESELPDALKQNVAKLGAFIFQKTIDLIENAEPEGFTALAEINRNIAAGLRGIPADA
ncbi:flagellar biosynthesis regulator FlaF [Alsobacter sp. KACC 23698]|uniref:Flagellar biosynthesis regulator FlaF n=1 Tax=Alsobacter sp. KACC 23698 TaxID=3149229 RepID=A0AAU7JAG5_9HYPH